MHIAFISKLSLQEREPQLKTKINTKKKGNLNYKQTDNWIKGPFNLRGGEGGGPSNLSCCNHQREVMIFCVFMRWIFVVGRYGC